MAISARAYHSLGKFQEAIEYFNQHLSIAKEAGDRAGEGIAYGNLGNCLSQPWKIPRSHRVLQSTPVNSQRSGQQGWRRNSLMAISATLITALENSKKP